MWVAVARHNFKWVNITIILFSILTVKKTAEKTSAINKFN